ncbi:hypothetical protein FGO68_gene9513 [Halteria grandinella]|uniref:Tubulin beta chain n=1 Tax=Halteria grandinella TaxID=5974 RepID=A0A8J8NSW9_HALGN|nr:hypothetical protein FGO68_gene9513 [Halteria grandinella]
MREIVTLQVGQCGNQIGYKFWESIAKEHDINPANGQWEGTNEKLIEKASVYFQDIDLSGGSFTSKIGAQSTIVQEKSIRYVPRAVLIDLEPGVLDAIRSSPSIGSFFKPDNFVQAQNGAGNNWSKGYYTEGAEIVEQVLDQVRREVEGTDCLQGFQMMHSLGGGTGSGLGSSLIDKLSQEYPEKIMMNLSVLPGSASSDATSDVVVEPYNTVFSLKSLVESSHMTLPIENQSLYRICTQTLGVQSPTFADVNYLISQSMSNITASLRFPGVANNSDLRKLSTNLIPFPRLHFITQGQAPLVARASSAYVTLDERELTQQLFDPRSFLCEGNPANGRFLTGSLLYRGQSVSIGEVEHQINAMSSKKKAHFVDWIPDRLMTSVCSVSPPHANIPMCGSSLFNSTTISQTFQRILEKYQKMYRKKAFLYQYTQEGMSEDEFHEAQASLEDLISQYQQYQEMQTGEDEEEEDEDMNVGAGAAKQSLSSSLRSFASGSTRPGSSMAGTPLKKGH